MPKPSSTAKETLGHRSDATAFGGTYSGEVHQEPRAVDMSP